MRTPSLKKLELVFQDKAVEAKNILKMCHAELSATVAGNARIKECHHAPSWVDVRMHVLNAIDSGLCGVEGLEHSTGNYAEYLNAGDTYAPTLIFWRGNYRVQSVGDFVEAIGTASILLPSVKNVMGRGAILILRETRAKFVAAMVILWMMNNAKNRLSTFSGNNKG